ncbi:uncharacterized protein LOC133878999 [Alnus glutinosa]|uniref:uncharacterized protein LOC133878999 n=1 Tax=Alnus glutinosa TaxID=3517 RepID=UPI002D783907|nr:uncharacterized protein LOC133878999 [Alnus glutinosa]
MKGIYIQPARATEEIRLNIRDIGESRSNQMKIIESVLSLLQQLVSNLLNLFGMTGASIQINRIPGAALQMQRELQWFKEVESISVPRYKEYSNTDGLTPRELFTKNHIDLKKEGEKWMKDTANSCTVVGALIITIMFAAAFTVPGGNKQDTGFPIFLDERLFMLFIISDALSLISSTTSVMMFLGILTSRYAEDDFLESLPRKMIIRTFHSFLFHCSHDDSLFYCSFHYATGTIFMDNHSCHLFGYCTCHLIRIDAISPSC